MQNNVHDATGDSRVVAEWYYIDADSGGETSVITSATRKGNWIQTATGKQFWPLDPRSEDVSLEDIACSLSKFPRFLSHVAPEVEPYFIAQHTVYVSLVAEEIAPSALKDLCALWGLHHDDHEAYRGDELSPIKGAGVVIGGVPLDSIELAIDKAIATALLLPNFSRPVRDIVALADARALATEKRDLMSPEPAQWGLVVAPFPFKLVPVPWRVAKRDYLARHADLMQRVLGSTLADFGGGTSGATD